MLIDTHVHLDDEQLRESVAAVLERARQAGVEQWIAIGTTLASSQACLELARRHSGVFASVGIHPNHCHEAAESDWVRIAELASNPGVVALGETGLDRYWDDAPFELQEEYFDRHLALSQATGLPVVVHLRDCEPDILRSLRAARERGELRGVMHSFSGTLATAKECLELGLYISFSGMVTYKKSDALREVAAAIPGDRLLLETDAPYLSPHPCRSQRPNEPALMVHTAACVAEVRGVELVTMAGQTTANARRLFGLPEVDSGNT